MPPVSFDGLLGVAAIAFGAPLLLGLAPRLRLPAIVLEIIAGIVAGGFKTAGLPIMDRHGSPSSARGAGGRGRDRL